MMHSMTGFGRAELHDDELELSAHLQTLNKRHLDINIQLPAFLSPLEISLRKQIKASVTRGQLSLRISARFKNRACYQVEPNAPLIQAYQNAWDTLGTKVPFPLERLVDHQEFFELKESFTEESLNEISEKLSKVLAEALEQLVASRAREGNEIAKDITAHLEDLKCLLKKVTPLVEQSQKSWIERLKQTLSQYHEALGDADELRLAKEAVLISDKVDVTEEIHRAGYHIEEAFSIIQSTEDTKGKRLEFIVQELFREINTIGSKSSHPEISGIVVELKCLLEKIREQVHNVE